MTNLGREEGQCSKVCVDGGGGVSVCLVLWERKECEYECVKRGGGWMSVCPLDVGETKAV